jgi:predicted metal-dependent peptidase
MTVILNPARKHLTKAKMLARSWMPYLSHILNSMRTYVGKDVPTMAVDEHGRLYVNEDWIGSLPVKQVAYVLLHEVMHVVLSHAKRRKVAIPVPDQEQCYWWNIAADLCIQQMLARHHRGDEPEVGVKLEGEWQGVKFRDIPGLRPGMTTEAYFGILLDYFRKQRKKDPAGGSGEQEGDQQPDQQGDGQGDEQDQQGGGQPAEPQPLDPTQCGSGSDGIRRDYEKPSRLADEAVMQGKLQELEQRLEEAERSSPGSTPGEMRMAVTARLHPQPDPFDQLRGIVARSVASPLGAEEHTYRRMHRRQPDNCARLRGVVRMAPECSVILDPSGSRCGGGIQERAMTAIAQGLRKVQRPRVVCFDTQVQDARRISSMKDFQWCGCGGTDMTTAIEQEDREQRPDAIVLITDGETHWPSQPTRARLIIALVSHPHYSQPPAWAKVVRCYEEGPQYGG